MTESFYDVLGVSDDATTEEIETAYREAVKEVHPDVSDDDDASRRTKRLNKAKRVLTDESERARYDEVGHDAYVDGGPGSGGGSSGAGSGTAGPRTTGSGVSNSGPGGNHRRKRRSSGTTGARSRHRGSGERRRRSGGSRSHETETTESNAANGASETGSRAADGGGATRSRTDSTGPDWQSGGAAGATSRSARRQAAATGPDGANVEWSWNSWSPQDAWAVRQDKAERGLAASRLFPPDQSLVLLASTFFCYPLFVGSALFPGFPLVVRAIVAACTLFMFAYLLSMPEVAIFVYGGWAVVATFALFAVPAVGLFSLVGVLALVATWIPLGISVLTFSILRT